jgi:hypothetical protein
VVFVVDAIPRILIDMLEHESAQARFVLLAAKGVNPHYSPCSDIRPLVDLANHLAQIPTLDFIFYTKKIDSFEQVHEKEMALRGSTIEDMVRVFDEGIATIKNHLQTLSDEEVQKKNLKAFYEQGLDKSWTYYIPEITTHLAMHKMQLWMYLKMAGAPVSMWTYYGVPRI